MFNLRICVQIKNIQSSHYLPLYPTFIWSNNSCLYLFQVVPYGSVPLKTYLPDGDIDLTILSGILSDGLAKDVISALEAETLNENAEFVVKDVQYICAEVSVSFH